MKEIKDLLKLIDDSVNGFVEGLSPVQKQTYKKLIELTKELDTYRDGTIKNSLNNIKIVGRLKSELDNIILNDDYLSKVSSFASSYDDIQRLQNIYFSTVAENFTKKKVFDEVKKVAIENTVEGLTDAGIGSAYTGEIKQMLTTAITSGGSYADLTKQLSDYVLGDSENEGALLKYGKQIATDSINGFNAQYNRVVSEDLGLTWFQYVGSLITTSRPFCKAMVEKRYFHISEVDEMLKGKIGDAKVALGKNGLPVGMIDGTNKQSFFIYRGGFFCSHQIFPVPLVNVPQDLRDKFGD